MATPLSTTIYLEADHLLVSQSGNGETIVISGERVQTGTVIQKGAKVIYDIDYIVTYKTDGSILMTVSGTTYTYIHQDAILYSQPPLV